jgi:O-antigen ligase
LVYAYKKKIIKIYFLLILVLAVGGMSSYMFTIPKFKHRFDNLVNVLSHRENIDYSKKESSTLRFSAIKASLIIIEDNWLYGVGTGDVVDELEKCYEENDFESAMTKHTNPHNQFIRSFVTSGIFGLISILLVFFVLAKSSLKNRSLLGFLYFVMMAFIFLFDDVFIFRDGVLFFSFFAPYFVFCKDSLKSGVIENESLVVDNENDNL